MKQLFVYILTVFIFACNAPKQKPACAPEPREQETKPELKICPAILENGSSLGQVIQMCIKLGAFEKALRLTSEVSIRHFGREKILERYRRLSYFPRLRLKSYDQNPDGTVTLNYSVSQFASRKIIRVVAVTENDSSKLLINDLAHILQ